MTLHPGSTLDPASTEAAPSTHQTRPQLLLRRWSGVCLGAVIALGCLARVVQWASPRSYSHDEISVLFSIRTLPLSELLFGHLILDQGSPMLWLGAERAMMALFGHGERTMRAVPMLLACASVVLVGLLARRVLRPVAAIVATGLFAVSPLASFYAWQVKPYSADMAASTGLLLLAISLSRRPDWTWRHGLAWWSAAALAAGFSFASLFHVGGVSLALVLVRLLMRPSATGPLDEAKTSDWRARFAECVRFCVPSVIWMGAAGFIYAVQLRHLDGLQGSYAMWLSGYAPAGASAKEFATWTLNVHKAVIDLVWLMPPTGRAFALTVLALACLGAVSLWRRDRGALLVVAAPLVVGFAVAVAHLYPLKGRLALWVVPALVLLIAEPVWPWRDGAGFDWAWWRDRRGQTLRLVTAVAVCAAVAVVALPAARSFAYITANPAGYDFALRAQNHDIEPLLDQIKAKQRPGDRFVPQEAYFNKSLWYGHERGLRVDGVLAIVTVDKSCEADAYKKAVGDAKRVWFIGGESWLVTKPPFVDVALAHLRTLGHVTKVASGDGVALYEVDLTSPPDASDAPQPDKSPCARFGSSFENPLD